MQTSQLTCEEHFEPIDVYCKNKECSLAKRICCNSCSQRYHNHQTTRLNDLKKDIQICLDQLEKKHKRLEQIKKQISNNFDSILKKLFEEILQFKQIINDFFSLSKTDLIKQISKIENKNILNLSEMIQNLVKSESSNPNNQDNTPDLEHLLLQYKYFLIDDNDEKQALGILNQILQKDKDNFIYQRERSRITHEILEYSTADERFFSGLYQEAIIGYDKLLQIRNDSRIHYQKDKYLFYILGLALTYIKNYPEAIKSIEQAISTEPENIQYQRTKSQILFVNNDIESLKVQALDQKNNFSSANLIIEGQILLLQKEYEKAQACFEEVVKNNYFSYESYFLLALTLSKIVNLDGQQKITLQQLLKQICDEKFIDMNHFNNYYKLYSQNNDQIDLNKLALQNLNNQMKKIKLQNKQNQPNSAQQSNK